ncbi:hypothetical protein ACWEO2_43475 [Nocardia sp. NPDC004278]
MTHGGGASTAVAESVTAGVNGKPSAAAGAVITSGAAMSPIVETQNFKPGFVIEYLSAVFELT